MLFTQQVFHLECLLFRTKSQPGVVYESVAYKRALNVAFRSSKNEKITLPHKFIFAFIWCFIRAIFSEKSCQKWGVWKNIKRGVGHRKGVQTFCTILRGWKGAPWSTELLGDTNWRGELIWKGGPLTSLHTMQG